MTAEKKRAKETSPEPDDDGAGEYFAVYEHYSNLLRTWLMAYGIGAPVLVLTNENLWKQVAASGSGSRIGWPFVVGVTLQALLAAANKATAWVVYFGQIRPEF